MNRNLHSKLILFTIIFASAICPYAGAQDTGLTEAEIKIGITTNIEGPTNARSKEMLAVAKATFDLVNKDGGVNGRQLKVISYDDKFDAKLALDNAKKLINEDKVFLLFGAYGTPPIKAFLPAAEASRVPIFSPTTGAQFLRAPVHRYVFNVKASYFTEAHAMLNFVANVLHETSFTVVYQDNAFGLDGRNGVQQFADKMKLKFTSIPFERDSKDITKAIEALALEKPKVILVWGNAEPAIALLEALKAKGLKPIFIGNAAHPTEQFNKAAAAYGAPVYLTQGVPLPTQKSLDLVKNFQRDMSRAGLTPNWSAVAAYLDALVLVEGLKRTGRNLTRESLINTMETKMTNVDFGGVKMSFSADDHQGIEDVFIVNEQAGDLVLFEK